MSGKTKIEWVTGPDGSPGATWNPVTGCSKVSRGCQHCYAERVFPRAYGRQYIDKLAAQGAPGETCRVPRKFTDVLCHPQRLKQPLHWKRPRKVFVNSMSDLFHDAVPDEFIDQVFAVMALCGQHQFQILTKRPLRMKTYMDGLSRSINPLEEYAHSIGHTFFDEGFPLLAWPIRNVWLGVSVEDQKTADERIPLLLYTPAAVRFVSYEPALESVDFGLYFRSPTIAPFNCNAAISDDNFPGLNWLICGSESGPNARPSSLDWFRNTREQCKASGVAFFMKQITQSGRKIPFEEWPEDLRVRQFPEVRA